MMKKETLQIQVYNYLIKNISEGKYKPNTQLREETIAKEVGVSTTPVREAFRRLEREGVVENRPYSGCVVKEFSKEEIMQLFLLRGSVETATIAEVIKHITYDEYLALRAIVDEEYSVVEMIRTEALPPEELEKLFFALDMKFHSTLVWASHQQRMIDIAESYRLQIVNYAFSFITDNSHFNYHRENAEISENAVDQHKAILTAILQKWTKAAQELMNAHITSGFERFLAGDLNKKDCERFQQ